jgi:hypothetical protein
MIFTIFPIFSESIMPMYTKITAIMLNNHLLDIFRPQNVSKRWINQDFFLWQIWPTNRRKVVLSWHTMNVCLCAAANKNVSYRRYNNCLRAEQIFGAIGAILSVLKKIRIIDIKLTFFSRFSAGSIKSTSTRELLMSSLRCPNMHKSIIQSMCCRNITVERSNKLFGI